MCSAAGAFNTQCRMDARKISLVEMGATMMIRRALRPVQSSYVTIP
jgi:hypothetical protein